MKKRERIRSQKSPDPSSPSRSGAFSREAASLCRSGEHYSPHRSGEGDTSAAASDGRGGGDEGKHWMNRSPSSGEETAVRMKRRCKQVRRRASDPMVKRRYQVPEEEVPQVIPGLDLLASGGMVSVSGGQKHEAFDRSVKISPSSNRPNLQEAGEVSSAPPPGKKEGKRIVSNTTEKKRLDAQFFRGLARRSGWYYTDAKEISSERKTGVTRSRKKKTSSALKVEKMPKPSSEDHCKIAHHCKIAQDEDEDEGGHSDSSLGLRASNSSSQSVEAREEGSFAEEETSSELKVEMNPKQSSEDLRKIAHDEDEEECGHSDKSLGLRASHTRIQSVEAHEKGSFDEEERSSGLKAEMNLKPSSEGHQKMAQDEDEDEDGSVHSNKSLSPTVDLSEISQDEDEQNSEKVGLHSIKDHRQEQGRAKEDLQTLLDLDNDIIEESIIYYLSQLEYVGPKDPYSCAVEEPQHVLFERLALYRIRGYELLMDRNLGKLDDSSLLKRYPPDILSEEGYFEHYEESLEWYFDPDLNDYPGLEDYQRLVLRDDDNYYDWDSFSSARNSYEVDQAYVQYHDALEKETKWVEDYLSEKTIPWTKIKNVAYLQALKIAANFPNVSPGLLESGFWVYIRRIEFDFLNYKGLDCLYFEIWKRVTKRKIDFTKALSEIYQENMFPSCTFHIELDMKSPMRSWTMRHRYDAYVSCIGDSVSDDEALLMIKEAVIEMHPKPKVYVDYARKKLEIAKDIGLIKEVVPVFPTLV